ncbi:hypothetical protein F0562_001652 [Nyssa sinensis]|uniref:Uncharacterized protein n=1 Tax=Nyssa sinensis TaxID=561372 RepID=A0A5J5C8U6_9ASTE|nr:hypothetical protein F0562_001652 [Nyssa sinensis]
MMVRWWARRVGGGCRGCGGGGYGESGVAGDVGAATTRGFGDGMRERKMRCGRSDGAVVVGDRWQVRDGGYGESGEAGDVGTATARGSAMMGVAVVDLWCWRCGGDDDGNAGRSTVVVAVRWAGGYGR